MTQARSLATALGALALLAPAAAWATQGREDTCMILTITFLDLPVGATMIGLGISSIVRLGRKAPPGPKAGRAVLVLSIVGFCLCIGLTVACMSVAGWDSGYSAALLTFSGPVLVLAATSTVLAWFLKRKARSARQTTEP